MFESGGVTGVKQRSYRPARFTAPGGQRPSFEADQVSIFQTLISSLHTPPSLLEKVLSNKVFCLGIL